jgi:hypothetical protein
MRAIVVGDSGLPTNTASHPSQAPSTGSFAIAPRGKTVSATAKTVAYGLQNVVRMSQGSRHWEKWIS